MKIILILVAVLLSVVSSAAPHYHRTRPRVPTAHRIIRTVPWKTVIAGGAAAGTVIAAYKISNGVEDGIKTVAKEKPEVMMRFPLWIGSSVCPCFSWSQVLAMCSEENGSPSNQLQ